MGGGTREMSTPVSVGNTAAPVTAVNLAETDADLPHDVWFKLLHSLRDPELVHVAGVNRTWRRAVRDFLESEPKYHWLKLTRPVEHVLKRHDKPVGLSPRRQLMHEVRMKDPSKWDDIVDILQSDIIACFIVRLPLSNGKLLAEGAERLARGKLMKLKGLDLSMHAIGAKGANALSLTDLRSLEYFGLSGNMLGDEGLEKLLHASFPRLTSLNLRDNNLTNRGISELVARWRHLPNLIHLDLSQNKIDHEGLNCLVGSNFTSIESLHLSGMAMGCDEAETIARMARAFPRLKKLDLSESALSSQGLSALLAATFENLESLNLSACEQPKQARSLEGGWDLVFSNERGPFPKLRQLDMSRCGLHSHSISLVTAMLAKSPMLEELNLAANHIADGELIALLDSMVSRLRKLVLTRNMISSRAVPFLGRSRACNSLKELDLSFNLLGDEGIDKLMCGKFPSLKKLWLEHNHIGSMGKTYLGAYAAAMPNLEEIHLGGNSLSLKVGAHGKMKF